MAEKKKIEFTPEEYNRIRNELIAKTKEQTEKEFKEKYEVRTEQEHLANEPIQVEINGKTYYVSALSLGVQRIVFKKIKKLVDNLGFNLEEMQKENPDYNQLIQKILAKLWKFIDEENFMEQTCEIIALIINNKNPKNLTEKDLKPEDLEFGLTMKDLVFILQKIIQFSDVQDFLVKLLAIQKMFRSQD